MTKVTKIMLSATFVCGLLYSLVANLPAWLLGNIANHYSQNRLDTTNEDGSFWNGHAMLIAKDSDTKSVVPLIMLGWKVKLGLTQFVTITFSAAKNTLAVATLSRAGFQINNLDLSLSLDQLAPLLGNLNSLALSGNVNVSSTEIKLAKKVQGIIKVKLEAVGSGIAPVNPIGSYQLDLDLAAQSLNVSSDADSIINVSGGGNFKSLVLKSRIKEDKKERLLQFMTMMGVPQADGSYQMKVF